MVASTPQKGARKKALRLSVGAPGAGGADNNGAAKAAGANAEHVGDSAAAAPSAVGGDAAAAVVPAYEGGVPTAAASAVSAALVATTSGAGAGGAAAESTAPEIVDLRTLSSLGENGGDISGYARRHFLDGEAAEADEASSLSSILPWSAPSTDGVGQDPNWSP